METQRLSHTIAQARDLTGLSAQTIYREISKGELSTFKVGTRRLISDQALRDWIARKEAAANG